MHNNFADANIFSMVITKVTVENKQKFDCQ